MWTRREALLVALAAVVFGAALLLRLPGQPMGDEPHYLALAQAIGEYHTFDPTPVYTNEDYRAYFPSPIDAHVAVVDGRPVPFHNVGAPLLFALPFLLLGRFGAHLVILAAALLTVLNVHRLQRDLGVGAGTATFVTGLFVLGSPLYVYAPMLFVEPLGMLAVVYAVRAVLDPAATRWRVLLAGAGIGYLPWVHGRYAIFPVLFGVLFAIGRKPAALVPLAVLALGLEVFNLVMYRSLSPAPGSTDALGEGLLQLNPARGLVYLAFDGRFGTAPNFPLLVLAAAGALLTTRRVNAVLLAVILPYCVIIATYPNWPGGFSPPGRLLAVCTPLLAYYVGVLLQRVPGWWLRVAAALAAAYGYVLALLCDLHPLERFHWVTDTGNPSLERLAALTGLPVDRMVGMAGVAEAPFVPWTAAAVIVAALLWWWGHRNLRDAPAADI
ncbi:hypothetical protein ACFFX1_35815 [Dactylosporangium sucinum]|uniref:Uncharacterized protein n=1 Tax=Dactylosporangium sucinum TaxID=1424081 RepID=A0A917UE49_9ACTN|nr:hypothetical protein [Dactylosporangium sucinum]GGM76910.1 hypothetical protein GCM10007977_093010 [Dactylosporangium sucinum]